MLQVSCHVYFSEWQMAICQPCLNDTRDFHQAE